MPDFFVDVATGNDANPGTAIGLPLRTIAAATVRAADAGGTGTIHVAEGAYSVATGELFPLLIAPGYALRGAGSRLTVIHFAGIGRATSSGIPYWGGMAIHASAVVSGLTVEAAIPGDGFTCNLTTAIYAEDVRTVFSDVRIRAPTAAAPLDGFWRGIHVTRSALAPPDLPIDLDAATLDVSYCSLGAVRCDGSGRVRNSGVRNVGGAPAAFGGTGIYLGSGDVEDCKIGGCDIGIIIDGDGHIRDCTLTGNALGAWMSGGGEIRGCTARVDAGIFPAGYAGGLLMQGRGTIADCDVVGIAGEIPIPVTCSALGVVSGCRLEHCRVNAGRIESCELTDGFLVCIFGAPDGGIRDCRIAAGWIGLGGDPWSDAPAVMDRPLAIAGNRVSGSVRGIDIDQARNVTVEDNDVRGMSDVALLIRDGAHALVRNNVLTHPGAITAALVRVTSGARAAFEYNGISNQLTGSPPSEEGLLGGHYAAIILESLAAFEGGVMRPGADFGGGPLGSHGRNLFGRLMVPHDPPIRVLVPGETFFRGNYWRPTTPGGTDILPDRYFAPVAGAIVHLDGAMADS